MSYKLILVASENSLTQSDTENLPNRDSWQWIDEQKAGYVTIENALSIETMTDLRGLYNAQKIDVFCVAENTPTKKLFLADMDSTIVTSETLDEIADEAGIKDKIAAITERAMQGELDFHAALKERVGLLTGLSADALERTLNNTQISPGGTQLLTALREQDIYCVLVSGGFTYFTSAIAKQLGFHNHHGNILNIEEDILSGTVGEPILDKDSKLTYLQEYTNKLSINLNETIAIGDGANDLPMLENAGLGIGYHPKPLVQNTILNCIIHTDLTSVLYLI